MLLARRAPLLILALRVPITISPILMPPADRGQHNRGFHMVKPEWGTKRTCPKCGTRFYDLNKEEPVACIECSETWYPEPVLKSKQPIPFEEDKKKKEAEPDSDLADDDLEDLDVGDDDAAADADVDLDTDDDLGISNDDNEIEHES
jgi:uncharacterized protein (TIGR02300 family)